MKKMKYWVGAVVSLQGPGTDKQAVQLMRNALAAEEVVVVELLNYRKDGSAFGTHCISDQFTTKKVNWFTSMEVNGMFQSARC